MKKCFKKLFLSSLLALFGQAELVQASGPYGPQGMPSVAETFGNRSPEDIISEVQEAQKFFESLSPEEMAEVEKMVEETLKYMSPQDLEDIQNIATMVEPHLDLPKKEIKEDVIVDVTAKEKTETKKSDLDTSNIDTSNIIDLVKDINKQVNEILQKADSSKELAEEINNKWTSKIALDNLVRNVLALKEERLAKKLSTKESKEDKELEEAIQAFHKDLTEDNKKFHVEDSFGIQESQTIEKKQMDQLQNILTMFETHIDKVSPKIEQFFTKHDPEKLELSKAAEERVKKAMDHAQDASVKRGSAPAVAQSSKQRTQGQDYSQPTSRSGRYAHGYNDSSFPEARVNYSSPTSSKDELPGLPTPAFKKDQKPSYETQPTTKAKDPTHSTKAKDPTHYDLFTDSLQDLMDQFDNKHEEEFISFLKNDTRKYPNPKNAEKAPSNPEERDQWINNEFANYENSINHNMTKFSRELDQINNSLTNNLQNVTKITDEKELKKLSESKDLKTLKSRIQKYKDAYMPAKEDIEKIYLNNVSVESDPLKGPMTLAEYKQRHRDFMQNLQKQIEVPLLDAEGAISGIEKKIKRKLQKKKD